MSGGVLSRFRWSRLGSLMPVRADRSARGSGRMSTNSAAVLATVRHLAEDIQDGPESSTAGRALDAIRQLLAVRGVALADASGTLRWSGTAAADADVSPLVRRAFRTERARGRPPLVAMPLCVHEDLDTVLVVSGKTDMSAVREVAAVVVRALEHGRLEDSAEYAAQAELRALRAEISPHFVYNALTVIASLVQTDPERAHELMLDFADYARYTFAQHDEYTTVAEEFRAIETYLALQRAVLGARLRVQIRVAPEVLAVAIPCFVLEPLVENAIRHGVEPRSEPGTVYVGGEADGDECVITVEDDGSGMTPDQAESLLAGTATSGSVGLANVDRRLRKVYGPWFGLVLETAAETGTRAVVRIPRFHPGVLP